MSHLRKILTLSVGLTLVTACSNIETSHNNQSHSEAPFTNLAPVTTSKSQRVNDLMAKMTLDEKLAQISCIWFDKAKVLNKDGSFNPEKMEELFPHGVGCIARPQDTVGMEDAGERKDINDSTVIRRLSARTPSETVDIINTIQKWHIENTRLGIPTLFHEEGLHGFQGRYATSFPQSIGLAATFDTDLIEEVMTGHGQPEAGQNVGPSQVSERVLRETFFPPFEAAVKEAGAASVMASYNEIDGIPSHANPWLLNDILRNEWGFDGVVVADYFAINELERRHHIVDNISDAGEISLKSGVDLELPDGVAFYELKEKIERGDLDIAYVDQAVRRVLEMKERGRVFETPFADGPTADALTGNQEARDVALEAAQKAAVLLKNDNNILPLQASDYKKIAVIGPNAAITVLGGYSDEPRQTISILDGIKAKIGSEKVVHAQGVTLTDNRSWWDDEVNLIDRDQNLSDIYKAVAVAKSADLVILAIGGDESTSREAWSETHMGDRDDITLIGEQKELIDALAKTGKPIIGVVISGRPLSLMNVENNLSAILYGWILGQETGTAVADLLFGEVSPSGKMPVSVPKTVGQIPVFYNHKPTARRGYAFTEGGPLYAFGHGLSYTTFDISDPVLSNPTIAKDGTANVSVTVTNTGNMSGDEIVQYYIRDKVSSVTRPVKELKGFKRVSLEPNESKTVSFPITTEALQFYNRDMKRIVEAGEFDIMVGNSSDSFKTTTLTVK